MISKSVRLAGMRIKKMLKYFFPLYEAINFITTLKYPELIREMLLCDKSRSLMFEYEMELPGMKVSHGSGANRDLLSSAVLNVPNYLDPSDL